MHRRPPTLLLDPHRLSKVRIEVESDHDVWVEYSYRTRAKDGKKKNVAYFRSTLTGSAQLFEPPTGASAVIYASERDYYNRQRLPGPLQKISKSTLHWPEATLTQSTNTTTGSKKRRWFGRKKQPKI